MRYRITILQDAFAIIERDTNTLIAKYKTIGMARYHVARLNNQLEPTDYTEAEYDAMYQAGEIDER